MNLITQTDYKMNITVQTHLNFKISTKGHFECTVHIFTEHSLESLLKQRRIEGISNDYLTPLKKKKRKKGYYCEHTPHVLSDTLL